MSTTKHPVGPQARSVYRRRRLMVGLGLLAVLAVILLIFFRPASGGEASPDAQPVATAAPDDTAAPEEPTITACDPGTVAVDAITDQDSYDPDEEPELSLTVTNTGTAPCTLNAGTTTQVFTITSGADVYWTSTDCQTDAADAEVTLEPKVPVSTKTPLVWDRTQSSPETCEISDREAAPGEGASYFLSVSVGGVASANPAQFLLN
jgi:hypothetical protein